MRGYPRFSADHAGVFLPWWIDFFCTFCSRRCRALSNAACSARSVMGSAITRCKGAIFNGCAIFFDINSPLVSEHDERMLSIQGFAATVGAAERNAEHGKIGCGSKQDVIKRRDGRPGFFDSIGSYCATAGRPNASVSIRRTCRCGHRFYLFYSQNDVRPHQVGYLHSAVFCGHLGWVAFDFVRFKIAWLWSPLTVCATQHREPNVSIAPRLPPDHYAGAANRRTPASGRCRRMSRPTCR